MVDNYNESFWNDYYTKTNDDIKDPSTFARFVYHHYIERYNENNVFKTIADLGCGNCRDSIFFSSKGNPCFAIDYNLKTSEVVPNCEFVKANVVEVMKNKQCDVCFDIIYMRWFLHAMPYDDAYDALNYSLNCLHPDGFICIEVRSINDHDLKCNSVYNDTDKSFTTTHKRWPFSIEMLTEFTKNKPCKIILQEEDYFSPNENTETKNPLLIRFIIQKT